MNLTTDATANQSSQPTALETYILVCNRKPIWSNVRINNVKSIPSSIGPLFISGGKFEDILRVGDDECENDTKYKGEVYIKEEKDQRKRISVDLSSIYTCKDKYLNKVKDLYR